MKDELFSIPPSLSPELRYRQYREEREAEFVEKAKSLGVFTFKIEDDPEPWTAVIGYDRNDLKFYRIESEDEAVRLISELAAFLDENGYMAYGFSEYDAVSKMNFGKKYEFKIMDFDQWRMENL